jgi:hypothetical protein
VLNSLLFVIILAGSSQQLPSLDEYLQSLPFVIGRAGATQDSTVIVHWSGQIDSLDQQSRARRYAYGADFIYLVRVTGWGSAAVSLEGSGDFGSKIGIARLTCEIISDLQFAEAGEVALFVYHADIAGSIEYIPTIISREQVINKTIVVFGKLVDGYRYIPTGWWYEVTDIAPDADPASITGIPRELSQMLVDKQHDIKAVAKSAAPSIVVEASLNGSQGYKTNVLDEDTQLAVRRAIVGSAAGTITLRSENAPSSLVGAASLSPSENYILLLREVGPQAYVLVNGKLSVLTVRDGDVFTSSGYDLGNYSAVVDSLARRWR